MDRNQQVMATAFKKAKSKILRIKQLGITPTMTEDAIEQIVIDLATVKALETQGKTIKDFLDGQQWYVESLVKASGLTGTEIFNAEYDDSFGDIASEEEMFGVLNAMQVPAEEESSEDTSSERDIPTDVSAGEAMTLLCTPPHSV